MTRRARKLAVEIGATLFVSLTWIGAPGSLGVAEARPGGGYRFDEAKDGSGKTLRSPASPRSPGARPSHGPRSEPWSDKPSYSAPWAFDEDLEAKKRAADRKRRGLPPSTRPPKPPTSSGSMFEYFFYGIVGIAVVLAGIALRSLQLSRGERSYTVGRGPEREGP